MMRFLLLIASTVAILAGCSAVSAPPEAVQIRIANESSIHFDEVIVGFPQQQELYGAIPAGSWTGYRTIDRPYRYAAIAVRVGTETFTIQPVDYAGESRLEGGRYTYSLDFEADGELLLNLRKED